MTVLRQAIPEIVILETKRFGDSRGYFFEAYSKRTFASMGLACDFVQDNISLSAVQGTVRGMHYQSPPAAQSKLVTVLRGSVLDVAIDIRKGSSTYGKHVAAELSAENGLQMLVPKGFAHGFCTLQPDTLVSYKVDAFYEPKCEFGLAWNDASLGIAWPGFAGAAVVDRDAAFPRLDQLPSHFIFGGC